MSERSLLAYQSYHDTSVRFDYFVSGLTGALCAYVAQHLKPERITFSPYLLELVALGFLIASVIFAFRRLESTVQLLKRMHGRLEFEEQLAAIVKGYTGNTMHTSQGELLTPERMQRRAELLRDAIAGAEQLQEQSITKSLRTYQYRNATLFVGFVLLVVAKVLHPYASP